MNFNEKMERAAQDGSEYLYGAVLTDNAAVPVQLRLQYAPNGVLQYTSFFDTNGCASRAPLNILETKLTYLYHNGLDERLKQWLWDKGYVFNGKIVLSDNFIEILSGTTRAGNSLKAPIDAIYRYGVIPAHYLPLAGTTSWEEYMDPKRITQEMRDLGQQFLMRFGINYEKVPLSQFSDAIEDDLLSVAVHAWPEPTGGVYPANDGQLNHAVAKVDNTIYVLDNYEPFTKILARGYKFFEWGYSISISRLTADPEPVFVPLYQRLIAAAQQLIFLLRTKVRGILKA